MLLSLSVIILSYIQILIPHKVDVLLFLDFLTLENGPIGFPETSVRNYQSKQRNSPEEGRSHLHRGGNLKSGCSEFCVFKIKLIALGCDLIVYYHAMPTWIN